MNENYRHVMECFLFFSELQSETEKGQPYLVHLIHLIQHSLTTHSVHEGDYIKSTCVTFSKLTLPEAISLISADRENIVFRK